MPPPPASLTIISCKYENRQRLQFTTEFAKTQTTTTRKHSTVLFYQVCADTVKAKQSTAEYWCRLCFFCPSNKLTLDLLTLKVVPESRVTWATAVPILVFLGLFCSRLRPNVRDRQTDVRSSDSIIALCPHLLGEGKMIISSLPVLRILASQG